jgi:hypothetical protein
MLGLITSLGGSIIDGVSGYFKTKQEIKKVKVEAEKKILVAEAEAKVARLAKEAEQDFDLDKIAMQNMEKSWKDELILVIFMIPLVMSFIPGMQEHVEAGFKALEGTPEWYQYIIIGMIVVIYGMRGLLKKVLDKKVGK